MHCLKAVISPTGQTEFGSAVSARASRKTFSRHAFYYVQLMALTPQSAFSTQQLPTVILLLLMELSLLTCYYKRAAELLQNNLSCLRTIHQRAHFFFDIAVLWHCAHSLLPCQAVESFCETQYTTSLALRASA